MAKVRVIPRLDVKAPYLIKSIQLEGVRKLGDPNEFARRYYEAGADEILYMDCVASLYGRNSLLDIIGTTASRVFVPITVGGGIRSVADVRDVLKAGGDKVAINTAAVRRPELLSEVARTFGSQCLVLSIEAKSLSPKGWEVYVDGGRERTGKDAVEWAMQAVALGIGEILVTSVDREGTRRGFDVDLVRAISDVVSVPVIASGGMGSAEHFVDVVVKGGADAVAVADVLHYNRMSLNDIRSAASAAHISVRQPAI